MKYFVRVRIDNNYLFFMNHLESLGYRWRAGHLPTNPFSAILANNVPLKIDGTDAGYVINIGFKGLNKLISLSNISDVFSGVLTHLNDLPIVSVDTFIKEYSNYEFEQYFSLEDL